MVDETTDVATITVAGCGYSMNMSKGVFCCSYNELLVGSDIRQALRQTGVLRRAYNRRFLQADCRYPTDNVTYDCLTVV